MQDAERKDYFAKRAAAERAAADQCDDARAAQSHRELAERYERQAKGETAEAPEETDGRPTILPPEFKILP